ncbi:MAG: Cu(I)-responsive transcriptional regulator [Methyloligella sp.]|jgi:Cu(I)-responsive transcriptional regulator|nr:MAG: Cu(I)-responsive transcriptional regulator [Methyloligella sp.]
MKIRDAAIQTDLTEKTIRYYEDIGLVVPMRRANGYRDFSEQDVHKLKFLARARKLGFSVDDCRQLLSLYSDRKRASKDVKNIAEAHLLEIEMKIQELSKMQDTLTFLVMNCKGNERPDCPIINDLAGKN